MTTKYTQHFNTKQTPQSQPVLGKSQVLNSAGGYVFEVSPLKQVERFLILGTEGGTFYVGEQKLTQQNAQNLVKVLESRDAEDALDLIVQVSTSNRTPKNDACIFALALACTVIKDTRLRSKAYDSIVSVCRTGTHLFQFLETVKSLRGWSEGLRRGVKAWYENKTADQLAYQLVKYRQRNNWTHRDAIRVAHPNTGDNQDVRWALGQDVKANELSRMIQGFIMAQNVGDSDTLVKVVTDYKLPWEALPTEALNHAKVWEALLPNMKPIAAIRNLGKMTKLGLFDSNLKNSTKVLLSKLAKENLVAEKVHPMTVLLGATTYARGHGVRGELSWNPNQKISDALTQAFYDSFGAVEPTHKNTMLALDVSGSMFGATIANTHITAGLGAAVMALVTANVEPNYDLVGFAAGTNGYGGRWGGTPSHLVDVKISPKMNLAEVERVMRSIPMGGTDCALPMIHATKNKLEVDTFVVYTDNETWAGNVHPFQALKEYRQKSGVPAKLVVVGMTATSFTIADPSDGGMLDVVGFDSATPNLIAEFSKD